MGRSELTALKLTTYNTFLDVAQDQLWLRRGIDFKLSNSNVIKFSNGSEIVLIDLKLYPWKDPNFDKLWSAEFTGGFIDEVNQIVFKAYQVASSRIGRYKNTQYGIPGILLMSCNPAKNRVYKEFYRKQKDGVIEPQKIFIQVLARHNPHIPADYLRKLSKMPPWPLKQRLYYGNREYDDTPGILFGYDDIYSLFKKRVNVSDDDERYLIVDVARHGVDRTTCIYREGMQGKILRYEERSDVKDLSERLAREGQNRNVKRRNIIVDEDGVGGWVVDNLWCTGFLNNGEVIPDTEGVKPNYQNLKTQCYFVLAEMIKEWLLWLDVGTVWSMTQSELEEMIQDELALIREVDIDKDGKRRILSKKELKEELGRSPDRADNLMMRMLPIIKKNPDLSWALSKDDEEDDQ